MSNDFDDQDASQMFFNFAQEFEEVFEEQVSEDDYWYHSPGEPHLSNDHPYDVLSGRRESRDDGFRSLFVAAVNTRGPHVLSGSKSVCETTGDVRSWSSISKKTNRLAN